MIPLPTLNRREFLKTSSAAAVAANISLPKKRSDKPNLLFLWTDEQRPDTFAVYGNKKIQTPHLNALASESFVFERPYCTQPVCTPSRSSIMTGLWPHQTGCLTNNIPLGADTPCLPELLGDPDYRTAYMGKWHLGDEVFAQHGFEEWKAIEDGYEKYYSEGRPQEAISSYAEYLQGLGYEPQTERGTYGRGFCARLPFDHCKPEYLKREAQDFLRRRQNEPFILHVNYLEPHMPFYGPLDDLHNPAEVDLPKNFSDELAENEPLRYRLMREHFRQAGFEDRPLKTEEDWRGLIARYWGLVSQVDRSVGGILATLEELGLADNTIVVYTSDHGDMMGSHRLLTKTVSYEESVGIPLMIKVPGKTRGQTYAPPVSQIDLTPTLLDLMGRPEVAHSLPGKSLVPRMSGEQSDQETVFCQWHPLRESVSGRWLPEDASPERKEEIQKALMASWRMAISPDGWKLCLREGDLSQLYNLEEDPQETTNLYGRPEHEAIVRDLSKRIKEQGESVGDEWVGRIG
jgi:arylsulfatase A-like enzyme